MGYNQNSRTGYKGNPTNCGLIAMSNLGLEPDPTDYNPKSGMNNRDILKAVRKQTPAKIFYDPFNYVPWWVRPTLKKFAKKHVKGLFMVFINRHVCVIDDGEVLNADEFDLKKRVLWACLVKRKAN